MDNPWLSPSINKHFSGRAGLEAQLIMGEEISPLFPPAPLQQLPVQGCSSHQTPPHIIYLWEECFQQLHSSQPQRGGIWGEGNLCNKVSWAVTHSGGMVFMEWPHQCQTSTRGRNQCVERSRLWELFQTYDHESCNSLLVSVGDCGNTTLLGGMWLRNLPKVHSWPRDSSRSQNI